jgi:hypothetical protein
VADRLDIVSVGIVDEGGVVIGMIVRADAGRAVVATAGGKRGAMKRIHRSAVLGEKGDMKRFAESAFATDPEIRITVCAEARRGRVMVGLTDFSQQHIVERRQRGTIKGLGTLVVGYRKADVIDHRRCRGQTCRSTSFSLRLAIALAGFSPLGQALVQFMMVWQR